MGERCSTHACKLSRNALSSLICRPSLDLKDNIKTGLNKGARMQSGVIWFMSRLNGGP